MSEMLSAPYRNEGWAETNCESARGEWGGICPDCGKPLPANPGPLRSWMASRPLREGMAWDGSAIRYPNLSAARRNRGAYIPRANRAVEFRGSRGVTDRQLEIRRIVEKNGGNKNAAARELGISVQTVIVSLHRSALA